jgi:hypothetical protein
MSTESQINANRLNAQKSTGPRTPEGKAKVSQNAVTHGLTAFRPVLAGEDHEEYALFRDDFFRHHAPVGILEETLAQHAADTFWRLQRAQNYETAVLNTLIHEAQNSDNPDISQIENLSPRDRTSKIENEKSLLGQILLDDFRQTHCLEKIQKYEMSLERSFFRTQKELRLLQSMRNVGEASVLHNNSVNSKVGEASVLHSNSANSKKEQNKPNIPNTDVISNIENNKNKPKIPTFDPIKLLESCIKNPTGLDPLTKIMMQKDNFQRLTKKAM